MEYQTLWHFAWTCFEEESQIDDFQAVLLALFISESMTTT